MDCSIVSARAKLDRALAEEARYKKAWVERRRRGGSWVVGANEEKNWLTQGIDHRDAEYAYFQAVRGYPQKRAERRQRRKQQKAVDALIRAANGEGEIGSANAYRKALKRDPCAYCGYEAPRDWGQDLDHIVPRCDGGADHWENLTAACSSCNGFTGKWTDSFLGWLLELDKRRTLIRRLTAEAIAKRYLQDV